MSQTLKLLILVSFLLITYLFFTPFLPALTMGVMVALTLNSALRKLLPKFSNLQKASLTTLVFALMVIIPLTFLIISGSVQAKSLLSQLSENPGQEIFNFINKNETIKGTLDSLKIDLTNYEQFISNNLESLKSNGVSLVQKILTTIPLIIFNFLLLLAAIFFTILDGSKVKEVFKNNSSISREFTVFFWKEFKVASQGIIISSLLTALAQAIIITIPALVLDLDNSLLIIFATFICSLIPLVGTAPVSVILVLANYFQSDYSSMIIYIIIGAILGVVDNIIRAKVIGESSQIHPLFAFLSALGGVMTFGFFGIFLGPLLFILSWKSLTYLLKEGKENG